MKKLFLVGTLFCVLCSCGSSNSNNNAVPANVHEGHEWVDLGLPSGLKWATCNVGAWNPEDYGDYYAWGEVNTKSVYERYNCSTYEKSLGNISGTPRYDVARAKWGGSWRMPTREEFEELIDNCTWKWTTKGGHNGYKVTGPNGNSIFLPAAGFGKVAGSFDKESDGYYWSTTPNESNTQLTYSYSQFSCSLHFCNLRTRGYWTTDWYDRGYGRSVRPVLD